MENRILRKQINDLMMAKLLKKGNHTDSESTASNTKRNNSPRSSPK